MNYNFQEKIMKRLCEPKTEKDIQHLLSNLRQCVLLDLEQVDFQNKLHI